MAKVGVSMGDLVSIKLGEQEEQEENVEKLLKDAEKEEEKEESASDQKKETESVTIRISKEEKKAFKALCAVRGVNMSDLLSDIVRDYLKENK